MNKAARAKLLAAEMENAPGIMSALACVLVILSAALVVGLSIYGLMYGVQLIDARGSLIGSSPQPGIPELQLVAGDPRCGDSAAAMTTRLRPLLLA